VNATGDDVGSADWPVRAQAAYVVLSLASSLGSIRLGRLIAVRLEAAGVGRGTRSPGRQRVPVA
jgi:hypothetical protein